MPVIPFIIGPMICALSGRDDRLAGRLSSRDPRQKSPRIEPAQRRRDVCRLLEKGVMVGVGFGLSTAVVSFPVSATELLLRNEPSNALSLPTWIIHVASVLEWVTAMGLIWRYGEVTDNERWKGMTWGMMPCLGGALCACTWHFFYNNPELEFLVTLQSVLTFLGNCTCGIAAYRIYDDALSQQSD